MRQEENFSKCVRRAESSRRSNGGGGVPGTRPPQEHVPAERPKSGKNARLSSRLMRAAREVSKAPLLIISEGYVRPCLCWCVCVRADVFAFFCLMNPGTASIGDETESQTRHRGPQPSPKSQRDTPPSGGFKQDGGSSTADKK